MCAFVTMLMLCSAGVPPERLPRPVNLPRCFDELCGANPPGAADASRTALPESPPFGGYSVCNSAIEALIQPWPGVL